MHSSSRRLFYEIKEVFAIKDVEAVTIARCLVNEVIYQFGVPDSLHTDQENPHYPISSAISINLLSVSTGLT